MNLYEYQVLLIDDDEDDYFHISTLLKNMVGSRCVLTWAPNYAEGLSAIHNEKFDICLLDHKLGAHTGIELLYEANKSGRICPVIILTGQSDFDLDIKAMQMGAADFLVKNQLTGPLLERAIRYTIKHAWDVRELRESEAQVLQQDRLASLGLLASSLAHEIGTPLGIIRSRAELAVKKYAQEPGIGGDMTAIISQIDKITKLVHALLNLARGKENASIVQVSLDRVLGDVLNLIQFELTRKSISLINQIPPGIVLKAEEGPLGQVLLNLMVNSIHAIEDKKASFQISELESGGGQSLTLEPKVSNQKIELAGSVVGDFFELSIEDTGSGISKEHMSQIFKPFFTTKDVGQGTGLGLATTYKILQSWGGHVKVESEKGKGAKFKLQIPLVNIQ